MTDKYIDLQDVINEDVETENVDVRFGIQWTLEYLDSNPDQVPGRTITERELANKRRLYGEGWSTGFLQAGGEIIPDPEPTNAERLETALLEAWDGHRSMSDVADLLDLKGVRAPEESK